MAFGHVRLRDFRAWAREQYCAWKIWVCDVEQPIPSPEVANLPRRDRKILEREVLLCGAKGGKIVLKRLRKLMEPFPFLSRQW